jgi:membrane protein involved in colicin uptake
MKRWKYSSILLIVLSLSVNAEVFKCKNGAGKIIYQPVACSPGAAMQSVIKVQEMTQEKTDEAKAKLEAWKRQQAVDDAAKLEVEKQRQAELEKQESIELQRRGVVAQEKQAIAEQQRQNPPIIVAPPYGGGRYWNNGGFPPDSSYDPNMMQHHPHHHHERGE